MSNRLLRQVFVLSKPRIYQYILTEHRFSSFILATVAFTEVDFIKLSLTFLRFYLSGDYIELRSMMSPRHFTVMGYMWVLGYFATRAWKTKILGSVNFYDKLEGHKTGPFLSLCQTVLYGLSLENSV